MKITKETLKQIIKEELTEINLAQKHHARGRAKSSTEREYTLGGGGREVKYQGYHVALMKALKSLKQAESVLRDIGVPSGPTPGSGAMVAAIRAAAKEVSRELAKTETTGEYRSQGIGRKRRARPTEFTADDV